MSATNFCKPTWSSSVPVWRALSPPSSVAWSPSLSSPFPPRLATERPSRVPPPSSACSTPVLPTSPSSTSIMASVPPSPPPLSHAQPAGNPEHLYPHPHNVLTTWRDTLIGECSSNHPPQPSSPQPHVP